MKSRAICWSAILALVFAAGCGDSPLTPASQVPPPQSSRSSTVVADSSQADSLARAIALALADPTLRTQVRDDLRDAPASRHAIHLATYLRGARGAALRVAMARALAGTSEQIEGLLSRLPALELVMERSVDRLNWTGTSDVVVYGTALPPALLVQQIRAHLGFRTDGAPVSVPLSTFARFPFLAVRPIESRFATDPEAERAGASKQQRTVVSTRKEELELLTYGLKGIGISGPLRSYDPCPGGDCGDGGGSSTVPVSGGVQLNSLYTWGYCIVNVPASDDADTDGLRDSCEQALATAFAPRLVMANEDRAPERDPRWSVTLMQQQWPDADVVKIFYALSYFRDPGSPVGNVEAHDGDSEFIIIELRPINQPSSWWRADYMTLSAHWNSGSPWDHTRRYTYTDIEWDMGAGGRPRAWVSKDKHANYNTRNICMAQVNDLCGYEYNYGVQMTQYWSDGNLGNVYNPAVQGEQHLTPVVYSHFPNLYGSSASQSEFYWNNSPYTSDFGGWHVRQGQTVAGGYGVSLSTFGF